MGFNSVALQPPPPLPTPRQPPPLYKDLNLPWVACYLVCSGHGGFGNHWSTPQNTLSEACIPKILNKQQVQHREGHWEAVPFTQFLFCYGHELPEAFIIST